MKISYKKLWMLLIQRDITKVRMKRDLGLAAGTMSKLNKGEDVALSVLLRICEYLVVTSGIFAKLCERETESRFSYSLYAIIWDWRRLCLNEVMKCRLLIT